MTPKPELNLVPHNLDVQEGQTKEDEGPKQIIQAKKYFEKVSAELQKNITEVSDDFLAEEVKKFLQEVGDIKWGKTKTMTERDVFNMTDWIQKNKILEKTTRGKELLDRINKI